MRVEIASVASSLPAKAVASEEIERQIIDLNPDLPFVPGMIKKVTGIETRRRADFELNTSDLAADAGRLALSNADLHVDDIDLLVFASASQDVIEPATAHIVQQKLGTRAAAFDVKNACNSFINGVQIAEALILAGQYSTALVVAGELPSRAIKWHVDSYADLRLSFAGYTFGDAGAAAVLRATTDRCGIFYRRFWSASQYWDLGGLLTGGSMHLRGDEFTYFRGDGIALKEAFSHIGPQFVLDALLESGTSYDDYARFFIHQVTMDYLDEFVRSAGIPRERVVATLNTYGNMASASLPVGLELAIQRGEVSRGDRVMLIGLAGGISLGALMFEY